jgi:hypothetical protein
MESVPVPSCRLLPLKYGRDGLGQTAKSFSSLGARSLNEEKEVRKTLLSHPNFSRYLWYETM